MQEKHAFRNCIHATYKQLSQQIEHPIADTGFPSDQLTMECTIRSVAFGGDGVARSDGLVVFIPNVLPEEILEIRLTEKKKNYAKGTALRILKPNPQRVPPLCPYFGTCGGCQLQHASYPLQLQLKRQFLQDSLDRIAKYPFPVLPIIPSASPFSYRRHIALQTKLLEGSWRLCFMTTTFTPLPIESCLLFHEAQDPILQQLQLAAKQLPADFPFAGRLKLLYTPHGYMGAFFPEHSLSETQEQILQGIFVPPLLQLSPAVLSFTCLGCSFSYSPLTFMQAHAQLQEKILELLVSLCKTSSTILDLYCGIGVSSILLARAGKTVVGVEINPKSILFARKNAQHNAVAVEFICHTAEDAFVKNCELFHPDTLLVNPPKTGLEKDLVRHIGLSAIEKIAYVSCHPPTLARDIARLSEHGFHLEMLQGFDCFPQTTHLETVAWLTR